MRPHAHAVALASALLLVAGCPPASPPDPGHSRATPPGTATAGSPTRGSGAIVLESPAFADGAPIPRAHAYRGEGDDRSPPLRWSVVPERARAFALVVEDPDAPAGTWVHWTIWNIPGDARALPAGVSMGPTPAEVPGARQGTTSWGEVGWGGPFPPPKDGPHHYVFTLTALDAPLDLEAGAPVDRLRAALEGHVLATGTLTGTYDR
jgi:Raf kinase inhibitor-like YbhB/YbcL family protein